MDLTRIVVLPGEGDKLSSIKEPWDGAAAIGQRTRSLVGAEGRLRKQEFGEWKDHL